MGFNGKTTMLDRLRYTTVRKWFELFGYRRNIWDLAQGLTEQSKEVCWTDCTKIYQAHKLVIMLQKRLGIRIRRGVC